MESQPRERKTCPYCGSANITKHRNKSEGNKRIYKCVKCRNIFNTPTLIMMQCKGNQTLNSLIEVNARRKLKKLNELKPEM